MVVIRAADQAGQQRIGGDDIDVGHVDRADSEVSDQGDDAGPNKPGGTLRVAVPWMLPGMVGIENP